MTQVSACPKMSILITLWGFYQDDVKFSLSSGVSRRNINTHRNVKVLHHVCYMDY